MKATLLSSLVFLAGTMACGGQLLAKDMRHGYIEPYGVTLCTTSTQDISAEYEKDHRRGYDYDNKVRVYTKKVGIAKELFLFSKTGNLVEVQFHRRLDLNLTMGDVFASFEKRYGQSEPTSLSSADRAIWHLKHVGNYILVLDIDRPSPSQKYFITLGWYNTGHPPHRQCPPSAIKHKHTSVPTF